MKYNNIKPSFVLFWSILLLLVAGTHSSCTKEKALEIVPPDPIDTFMNLCDSLMITFDDDIKTIMDANCNGAGCHDNGTAHGGVILETYMEVKDETENGHVICAIKHECSVMPSGSAQLADSIIEEIECWVENGFLEN